MPLKPTYKQQSEKEKKKATIKDTFLKRQKGIIMP